MKTTQFITGFHAITHILHYSPQRIIEIFISKQRQDQRQQDCLALAQAQGFTVQVVPDKTLTQLADSAQHQGIIARCLPFVPYSEAELYTAIEQHNQGLWLILEGITDPHNLGACLRSADGAGVQGVILPKHHSASFTAVVHKVASGAVENLSIYTVTNLVQSIKKLKAAGIWIYGLSGMATQSLYEVTLTEHMALVLGAEDKGLKTSTQQQCDELVKLPMMGVVNSLNVSVATGVSLYEVVRQRSLMP